MSSHNVRFSMQDDDNESTLEAQDIEEIQKLKQMTMQEGLLGSGRAQSPANSAPVSRTTSSTSNLMDKSASTAARHGQHSRIHSPDTSPPLTPRGDPHVEDPYRRSARLPQSTSLADIAPQFIFQKHASGGHSSSSTSSHVHLKDFFHSHHNKDTGHNRDLLEHKHHSGFDLGRFFRHGHSKRSGHSTPTTNASSQSSIYMAEFESKVPKKVKGEDHMGFHQKYGKAGKILGSGAGGSVRIMKRLSDNHLYAVKEFRERGISESQKDYNKKVTAEFCVASAMHHSNVIETMEVLKDNQKWYQIMEYAPFDLFAIVMTGKMQKLEVFCCFKQVLRGVEYLHSMGLAHRDLKLDNLVVDEHGIVKIIDFGSAIVFKYPFEEEIHEASGIVGSDPYLSPEVCTNLRYSPEPADIWSCAIVFCCMWLRRFPWKSPRLSDNSFKSFAATDPLSDEKCQPDMMRTLPIETQQSNNSAGTGQDALPVIRGPWRLLRLLPPESRTVIKGMLELEPTKRYTMRDIILDEWVQATDMCYEDKTTRTTYRSALHDHVLIGPEAAPKNKK